jgi:hypothetical protein
MILLENASSFLQGPYHPEKGSWLHRQPCPAVIISNEKKQTRTHLLLLRGKVTIPPVHDVIIF